MLTDFLLKQKKILNKSTNSDLPLGGCNRLNFYGCCTDYRGCTPDSTLFLIYAHK